MQFLYRVVFFQQEGCHACSAMKPIWIEAANEIAEEYPDLGIGFGEWDVRSDDWAFCDSVGCDGTPNFAVFDSEAKLLGLNTTGIVSKLELKTFIVNSINNNDNKVLKA